MAKTKEQKGVIIDKLEDAFKTATIVRFRALYESRRCRRIGDAPQLSKDGVSYFVAKKTLMRRALERLGHKHEDLPLEGEVAIAYGGAGGRDRSGAPRARIREEADR